MQCGQRQEGSQSRSTRLLGIKAAHKTPVASCLAVPARDIITTALLVAELRKELADRLRTSSPELFKTDPPSAPHPAAAANVQADRNVEQAAQEPEKPEVSCREDDTAIKSHATVQVKPGQVSGRFLTFGSSWPLCGRRELLRTRTCRFVPLCPASLTCAASGSPSLVFMARFFARADGRAAAAGRRWGQHRSHARTC